MPNRIKKINSLIQEELSQILLKEFDFPKDVLVTITRVETIINLSDTRIYVSVIPENQIDQIFEILERRIYNIQQCLNRRLNMRPVPKIEFKKEEKTQQAAQVEELLEKLKKK